MELPHRGNVGSSASLKERMPIGDGVMWRVRFQPPAGRIAHGPGLDTPDLCKQLLNPLLLSPFRTEIIMMHHVLSGKDEANQVVKYLDIILQRRSVTVHLAKSD